MRPSPSTSSRSPPRWTRWRRSVSIRQNAFGFWDWVGGRYSVDSAIGTSVAVAIGPENFADFLSGFHAIDTHFKEAPFDVNVPVLMGLLNVWYVNFFGAGSHAVLPYAQFLHRFAAYLQQLTMESNGKSVRYDGSPVTTQTGEVFWGEPGTNGQHAFYQLIHQGTQMIPADFIAVANPAHPLTDGGADVHELFLANFFAQTAALAFGKTAEEVRAEGTAEAIVPARVFSGNRPTTSIMAPALTPSVVGQLIALYEHITFVQGVVWGIDSFDQWGVELGKQLALKVTPAVTGDEDALDEQDVSTRGLIRYYRSQRYPDPPCVAALTPDLSADQPSACSGTPVKRSELGALRPELVDLFHRAAQIAEPALGVLADQLDGPGQRLGTGSGDAGVDEGVEHLPLGLLEPGHHRHGDVGEQRPGVAQLGAPGDLPAVASLSLFGDLDPGGPGLGPEPADPALGRGGILHRLIGQRADHGDLLPIDGHRHIGEPLTREPTFEPRLGVVGRRYIDVLPATRPAEAAPSTAAASTTPALVAFVSSAPAASVEPLVLMPIHVASSLVHHMITLLHVTLESSAHADTQSWRVHPPRTASRRIVGGSAAGVGSGEDLADVVGGEEVSRGKGAGVDLDESVHGAPGSRRSHREVPASRAAAVRGWPA